MGAQLLAITTAHLRVREGTQLVNVFSRGLVSQLFWRLSPSEQFAQMRMADAGARARLTASLSESSLRDDPPYLRRSQQQLRCYVTPQGWRSILFSLSPDGFGTYSAIVAGCVNPVQQRSISDWYFGSRCEVALFPSRVLA